MPRNARRIALLMAMVILFIPAAGPTNTVKAQPEDYQPGVLLVGLRANHGPRVMSLPDAATFAESSNELQKLNVVRINVPAGEEETYRLKLLEDPQVVFAEPDYRVKADVIPDDPRWDEQYGPKAVRAPQAWDVTTGSSDVIVAVLDSGLDTGHLEFSGRLLRGRDFVEGDNTPQDQCGHGTHVAGILAANGDNSRGVAGIDWHAKIMPVRVLGRTCDGWISDVVAGMVYAVDHGAKVINLSLGTSSPSTLLENGTYYAYLKGVAIFAAAGNAGISSLFYPARYPWVMAVGAVGQSNGHAAFSNESDNQQDMMVVAPGVQILSTTPRGSFFYRQFNGTTPNYGYLNGTSMAAPFVSGAAALMISHGGFDTPDKLFQALYHTALDLGDPGYDQFFGYGLIQIDLALEFTDFTPVTPPPEVDAEYDWISSTDCPYLPYRWVDARARGTRLPIFGTDGWTVVELPFAFNFAGQEYARVTVSANGFITFETPGGLSTERENFLIPGFAPPNNFIAPYWDDLNPSGGGAIYSFNQNDEAVVIEWYQVPRQGFTIDESTLTFEVILYAGSGEVLFQYQTLDGYSANGSSATVGLEFGDGYGGSQFSYNQPKLKEEQAILFVPAEPGSTRNLRNCLFVTSQDFRGCDQMNPFGVDIFDGLIPPDTPTELTLRLLQDAPAWPEYYLSMGEFVDITLQPSPPTPFDPAPMVCYAYTMEDVLKAGGHASNLFIATFSQGGWHKLPTVVNTASGQIMAPASHFTNFGVFSTTPEGLPVTGADYRWLIGMVGAGLAAASFYLLRRR